MAISSSWRYSLSASSTPAIKVPSAIDSPSASINNADPSTSSSVAAVNTSRTPDAAIKRNTGRNRKRPPISIPAKASTFIAIFAQSKWSSPEPASSGTSASAGMTAKSRNSSTENPADRLRYGSSPCRASSAGPSPSTTSQGLSRRSPPPAVRNSSALTGHPESRR